MHIPTLLLVDEVGGAPARLLREFALGDLTVTASGAEALGLVAHHAFDVVLASWRVETPSGIPLLREVARLAPRCERVLLSSYGQSAGLAAAMGEGIVCAHLPLPIDLRQLRALIEHVGARDDVRGQTPRAVVLAEAAILPCLEALLIDDDLSVRRANATSPRPGRVGEVEADVALYQTEMTASLVAGVRWLVQAGSWDGGHEGARAAGRQLALLPPLEPEDESPGDLRELVSAFERRVIAEALARHGGNRTRTAKALGMTRQGLASKLKKLVR